MRSLKTSGGITRGRFISPSTIAKWVHSMPGTSRLIDAMETFNGVVRITSEQPVALLESNQRHSDIRNLVKPAQPVSASVTSSRISREWCCGCQLRRCSVLWRSVHEGYGRDAAQCNSPAANEQCPVISKCDEGGESTRRGVCFNPTYWFHRIVCIVRSEEELLGYLTYELVACPPAIFDDCSLRKGNKSSIVTVLDDLAPSGSQPPSTAVYTIDGSHLRHRVVWQHPSRYGHICEQYKQYTTK